MASYSAYSAIWQTTSVVAGSLWLAFLLVQIVTAILTLSWRDGANHVRGQQAGVASTGAKSGKTKSAKLSTIKQPSRRHRGRCECLLRRAARRTAAIFPRLLNGRAWHIPIRAEDAAVSGQRLQPFVAIRALVEKPACVCRHGFGRHRSATGARDRGNSLHHAPPSARISGCSIKPHSADRPIIVVAISNDSRAVLPRTGFSQPSALQTRALRK